MNYFEFYDIPESLTVDETVLKQRFYAKSKQFHPDFFTLDEVEKQMEALELSTKNNTAYKTLIDFDSRLEYFLKLHDRMEEEGNNQIPHDFLMDMMEVNEAVMELQFDFDQSQYDKINDEVEATEAELYREIEGILPKAADQIDEKEFEQLKAYYLKSKYLHRLKDNLKKLASQ